MRLGVGVSGTGRIGRLLIRKILSDNTCPILLKAINTLYPIETIVHLLKYDSVHGLWEAELSISDNSLVVNGRRVEVIREREPELIPWKDFGVDIVVDATGKFNDRSGASKHLVGGASTVVLTAPGNQVDQTIVMGVNDQKYDPANHFLLSAASCTTNCLVPLLNILDQSFDVNRVGFTTIHSYTSDQRHLDNPHQDLRRARACSQSIVPTSTGAGDSIKDILPRLAPLVSGFSIRVPTPDVSLLDLTVGVSRRLSYSEVHAALLSAVSGEYSSYVDYIEAPLVSIDFVGCDKSAVIDGLSLTVRDDQIKLLAWYDNEWGYVSRVMDLVSMVIHKKTGSA
ncbi:type I glyceraldehyde-3-phosphate dehydrogenase [Cohnella silvisoli]|uniref:Glyceraldehyde 3-phosphate dehydrogenase NAD-binding domain-containing protein n=1 Tax=Cohnella silvisoli TaxID=2873699 RepID=A0ABV1KQF2_9BACL|nr:glyceraldehyde 3-phosphate dehydrogenase NAD-binding domain-containing protein [Cohnella silvisoli]MCD9022045.1 type I glyceraldehyde-3-phosphate dehydrogenase [Cohnella silvisoli]